MSSELNPTSIYFKEITANSTCAQAFQITNTLSVQCYVRINNLTELLKLGVISVHLIKDIRAYQSIDCSTVTDNNRSTQDRSVDKGSNLVDITSLSFYQSSLLAPGLSIHFELRLTTLNDVLTIASTVQCTLMPNNPRYLSSARELLLPFHINPREVHIYVLDADSNINCSSTDIDLNSHSIELIDFGRHCYLYQKYQKCLKIVNNGSTGSYIQLEGDLEQYLVKNQEAENNSLSLFQCSEPMNKKIYLPPKTIHNINIKFQSKVVTTIVTSLLFSIYSDNTSCMDSIEECNLSSEMRHCIVIKAGCIPYPITILKSNYDLQCCFLNTIYRLKATIIYDKQLDFHSSLTVPSKLRKVSPVIQGICAKFISICPTFQYIKPGESVEFQFKIVFDSSLIHLKLDSKDHNSIENNINLDIPVHFCVEDALNGPLCHISALVNVNPYSVDVKMNSEQPFPQKAVNSLNTTIYNGKPAFAFFTQFYNIPRYLTIEINNKLPIHQAFVITTDHPLIRKIHPKCLQIAPGGKQTFHVITNCDLMYMLKHCIDYSNVLNNRHSNTKTKLKVACAHKRALSVKVDNIQNIYTQISNKNFNFSFNLKITSNYNHTQAIKVSGDLGIKPVNLSKAFISFPAVNIHGAHQSILYLYNFDPCYSYDFDMGLMSSLEDEKCADFLTSCIQFSPRHGTIAPLSTIGVIITEILPYNAFKSMCKSKDLQNNCEDNFKEIMTKLCFKVIKSEILDIYAGNIIILCRISRTPSTIKSISTIDTSMNYNLYVNSIIKFKDAVLLHELGNLADSANMLTLKDNHLCLDFGTVVFNSSLMREITFYINPLMHTNINYVSRPLEFNEIEVSVIVRSTKDVSCFYVISNKALSEGAYCFHILFLPYRYQEIVEYCHSCLFNGTLVIQVLHKRSKQTTIINEISVLLSGSAIDASFTYYLSCPINNESPVTKSNAKNGPSRTARNEFAVDSCPGLENYIEFDPCSIHQDQCKYVYIKNNTEIPIDLEIGFTKVNSGTELGHALSKNKNFYDSKCLVFHTNEDIIHIMPTEIIPVAIHFKPKSEKMSNYNVLAVLSIKLYDKTLASIKKTFQLCQKTIDYSNIELLVGGHVYNTHVFLSVPPSVFIKYSEYNYLNKDNLNRIVLNNDYLRNNRNNKSLQHDQMGNTELGSKLNPYRINFNLNSIKTSIGFSLNISIFNACSELANNPLHSISKAEFFVEIINKPKLSIWSILPSNGVISNDTAKEPCANTTSVTLSIEVDPNISKLGREGSILNIYDINTTLSDEVNFCLIIKPINKSDVNNTTLPQVQTYYFKAMSTINKIEESKLTQSISIPESNKNSSKYDQYQCILDNSLLNMQNIQRLIE